MYTIFLMDQDGGERGYLEAEHLEDLLDMVDNLDGSDAIERGCGWVGPEYDVIFPDDREVPLEECYKIAKMC
jgi:hypothetical protein